MFWEGTWGMTKEQMAKHYLVVLKRYKDTFGYAPNPDDYIYLSLDQFYGVLIKCLHTGKEVNKFLISKKNYSKLTNA